MITFFLSSFCSREKKDADRTRYNSKRSKGDPTLFEIILNPESLLAESTEEPTLFDIVLRPEQFIYDSSEELLPTNLGKEESSYEQEFQEPNDYDQFRYEFTTAQSIGHSLTQKAALFFADSDMTKEFEFITEEVVESSSKALSTKL